CYSIFLNFKGGKGAATTGGIILYLMPKLFPLVIILWFFAQKTNPRSLKILITCILIYFIFLALFYKQHFIQLSISTLLLILIGAIINKDVIQEIKKYKKEKKNGNLEKEDL
ncbi:MAG: glycerol-3-phosphate acyltransferase, partial [Candidatus Omnitrophica bacterium]|nr:glycerol-3-phosphate acyltransferase [Candidatus Omnitrophota bacterium]